MKLIKKTAHILLKKEVFTKHIPSHLEINISGWVTYLSFFCIAIRKVALLSFKETNKILFEKKCGNYEAKILSLNKYVIVDLKWWLWAIPNAKDEINTSQVSFEINTVASKTGWEAANGSNSTWGYWSENKKIYYINYLEVAALKHGVINYEDIWKVNLWIM